MSTSHTVELESGHDITVTVHNLELGWVIGEIDLETHPFEALDGSDFCGRVHPSLQAALDEAKRIASAHLAKRRSK